MNKTEQVIINIMKALYNITEEQEKELIESFSSVSESDKEEFYIKLNETFIHNKNLLSLYKWKMQKLKNRLDEYEENLWYEKILEQI